MKPVVAVTTWKRNVDTFLGPKIGLHTLVEQYGHALDRAGAIFMLVADLHPTDADLILDRVDGLVVTGGGDIDPARYGQANTASVRIETSHDARDIALIQGAKMRRMPVLGICRGLQALNVAFGGTLTQHVLADANTSHPPHSDEAIERNEHRHVVEFDDGCRLADIYGVEERKVNSLHHQAVVAVGQGLVVVGRSLDGSIEAVESTDPAWPVMAVQWHPEMLEQDAAEDGLFAAFVKDAAAFSSLPTS